MIASNGNTLGTVAGVTKFSGSDPAMVARQENGAWLVIPVDTQGLVPMAFLVLYTDANCATPYVPMDSNPAPLFRLLQTANRGDTTAYYAGEPSVTSTFVAMSPLGHPELCSPTAGSGWDVPMLAGPLKTFDLSPFPAPFTVK